MASSSRPTETDARGNGTERHDLSSHSSTTGMDDDYYRSSAVIAGVEDDGTRPSQKLLLGTPASSSEDSQNHLRQGEQEYQSTESGTQDDHGQSDHGDDDDKTEMGEDEEDDDEVGTFLEMGLDDGRASLPFSEVSHFDRERPSWSVMRANAEKVKAMKEEKGVGRGKDDDDADLTSTLYEESVEQEQKKAPQYRESIVTLEGALDEDTESEEADPGDEKTSTRDDDDTESEKLELMDEEVPDQGEVPITLLRGHSFLRKELSSTDFGYSEQREELLSVDYTPAINIRPIDLQTPLKCVRLGRSIDIAICVTMYNENVEDLMESLEGIAENLPYLDANGVEWTNILVCVVADGRLKMDKSVVEYMSEKLLVYDEDLLLSKHKGFDTTCHLFEKTVALPKSGGEHHDPMQLLFAVKEKNSGKLNSHLWFCSSFCRQLQPKYCIFMDVGTRPRPKALWYLYREFERNPQLGGAAGEIKAKRAALSRILEGAQDFEYQIGHILEKPMESVFGYVTVLPGAFSAYRWQAIRGEPLSQYFRLEESEPLKMGPFVANMYLAGTLAYC